MGEVPQYSETSPAPPEASWDQYGLVLSQITHALTMNTVLRCKRGRRNPGSSWEAVVEARRHDSLMGRSSPYLRRSFWWLWSTDHCWGRCLGCMESRKCWRQRLSSCMRERRPPCV